MVGVDESTELWRPPPKLMKLWAVVIAQLMERFLQFQRSAVRIPSLAKILHFTVNCIEKTKIKKKKPGKAHLKLFQLWTQKFERQLPTFQKTHF